MRVPGPGARQIRSTARSSHKAGEDKKAAQAVAVTLVRQEEAAEADHCGQRHGDLTSSVHVSFPLYLPPMTPARDDRFRSLREAFVVGGLIVGEKQEQIKDEIGVPAKFLPAVGRARPCLSPLVLRRSSGTLTRSGDSGGRKIASHRHCVEQVSLTPFIVRMALCPLIQNSMSASA